MITRFIFRIGQGLWLSGAVQLALISSEPDFTVGEMVTALPAFGFLYVASIIWVCVAFLNFRAASSAATQRARAFVDDNLDTTSAR